MRAESVARSMGNASTAKYVWTYDESEDGLPMRKHHRRDTLRINWIALLTIFPSAMKY